jgi:hypothetical protein
MEKVLAGFSSIVRKEILEGLTTKVSVEIKIEEEAQYKTLQPK